MLFISKRKGVRMQKVFKKFISLFFVLVCIVNNANGSELTQNIEKTLAVAAVPVGLAANANMQDAKTGAYIKLLDDVLVIANRAASFYNKSINDSRDLGYYKILDTLYRLRDMSAQVRSIKKPVSVEEINNQELLQIARSLSLSLVQSAARAYVAFNTEDTEEQRKIRYWCDAIAFFANRLSDLTSNAKISTEEYEYQLVGVTTGLLLLLAYAPERFRPQVAVDQVQVAVKQGLDELVKVGRKALEHGGRAGRKILEHGGRAGSKALEHGGNAGRKILKEAAPHARGLVDRASRLLNKGKRAAADLGDSLA